jgi:8-oxo-dGTP pyrophosphatase MutT (NUDIX family)
VCQALRRRTAQARRPRGGGRRIAGVPQPLRCRTAHTQGAAIPDSTRWCGVSADFDQIGSETIYEGKFLDVVRARFRYDDGDEVDRELVRHPGAVGVVALDDQHQIWLVRQPREAVDVPDLLEIPAGKLDLEGEEPLTAARRELAEEIGKQAAHWESLGSFYTSPGFASEEIHLYLATGISDVAARPEAEENERIDIEVRPLSDLDAILATNQDSKTLIALYRLKDRLSRG